jgi:hypothetical protein
MLYAPDRMRLKFVWGPPGVNSDWLEAVTQQNGKRQARGSFNGPNDDSRFAILGPLSLSLFHFLPLSLTHTHNRRKRLVRELLSTPRSFTAAALALPKGVVPICTFLYLTAHGTEYLLDHCFF